MGALNTNYLIQSISEVMICSREQQFVASEDS
jgi:hypothetical protein